MPLLSRANARLALAFGACLSGHASAQFHRVHEPLLDFPDVELAPLRPIDLLASDGAAPAIRDVRDFCLLDEHRLAILRSDQTVLVVSDRGEVLRQFALPGFRMPVGPLRWHVDDFDALTRTGPERLILSPGWSVGDQALSPTALLELDLTSGAMRIPAFLPPGAQNIAIAGNPSGEFALLVHPDLDETRLYVVDADGTLSWSREKRVCQGYELCFTGNDRIAVLDRGQDAVQLFRWHGWWSTYTQLGLRSPERTAPSAFQCTPTGEYLFLCSSREGAEVLRTSDDFNLLGSLRPRHLEETPIDARIRVSPAGRVWASDWYSISRIGQDGFAEITLGVGPEQHRLVSAREVAIDRDDSIFAIADRDAALHEFDRTGLRVRVTPRPTGAPLFRSSDYVPKGLESLFGWGLHGRFEGRSWEMDWSSLRLLDEHGSRLFEASLGDEYRVAGPAADGAIALLRFTRERIAGESKVLDSRALERTRWGLPDLAGNFESADFDGRCLVVALPDELLGWHADGRPWFHAQIPFSCSHGGCGMMASTCWRVHLTREGREVWLRRGPEATTIERYALP